MFDFDQMCALPTWQTALSVGVILRFPFPMSDDATPSAPRPCLVLEVERGGAAPRIVLAPGATHEANAGDCYDIVVSSPAEFRAAGLTRAYRFQARRPLSVALGQSGVHVALPVLSPVMGRLTGSAHARMQRLRARLHAEHDIASERRREAAAAAVDVSLKPAPLRLRDDLPAG